MPLSNFFKGATRKFSVTISVGAVAQNITGDTVRLVLKTAKGDTDASAAIDENADVITNGASGQADFDLTTTITDIALGTYHYDLVWVPGTDEYILEQSSVICLEKVID